MEDVSGAQLDDVVLNIIVVVVLVVMSLDLFQQLTATGVLHSPEFEVFMQLERLCSVPLHCSVYDSSFQAMTWLRVPLEAAEDVQ